ncbi:type II toxin-antitoxin system RelE/ParE family toxin [Paraflavitalea speifideaquila]|uniref:type II toxin-antitoxin system RelE/ParE family toxin n=1 Tax=Paraflavitalea speifideaquila TaxID=3076558 RepID=UPI0028ED9BB5|nr:type II toxin-antitoxin system RelE/ParE family toxin [Paraflavitalea speifideiaquila]
MNYRLDFHEDVEGDYLEAYTWYETAREGLGERFLKMVKAKLEQIAKTPEVFGQKTKSGYRAATVDVFPYIIVYKLYKKERVVFVNAVIHQKKHPRKRHRK